MKENNVTWYFDLVFYVDSNFENSRKQLGFEE
jgi:hypothetical protein